MRKSWVAVPIALQAYWVGAIMVMVTLRPDWLVHILTEPTLRGLACVAICPLASIVAAPLGVFAYDDRPAALIIPVVGLACAALAAATWTKLCDLVNSEDSP